jgi:hypothetical protein
MRTQLLTVCLTMFALTAFGQKELLDAEKYRFEVMAKKDTKTLETILADDLMYTHSHGGVDGKAKIIESVAAGTYKNVEILEQNPISWGNTGVISGKARFLIGDPKGDRTIILKYTDVYRKEKGTWKLAAWQSLLVTE